MQDKAALTAATLFAGTHQRPQADALGEVSRHVEPGVALDHVHVVTVQGVTGPVGHLDSILRRLKWGSPTGRRCPLPLCSLRLLAPLAVTWKDDLTRAFMSQKQFGGSISVRACTVPTSGCPVGVGQVGSSRPRSMPTLIHGWHALPQHQRCKQANRQTTPDDRRGRYLRAARSLSLSFSLSLARSRSRPWPSRSRSRSAAGQVARVTASTDLAHIKPRQKDVLLLETPANDGRLMLCYEGGPAEKATDLGMRESRCPELPGVPGAC